MGLGNSRAIFSCSTPERRSRSGIVGTNVQDMEKKVYKLKSTKLKNYEDCRMRMKNPLRVFRL